MANMSQLIKQARRLLDTMDPTAKQALIKSVRQSARQGGDTATIVRNVLLNMDPGTRHRLEQQLGMQLDQRTIENLDAAGLNKLIAQLTRSR